MYTVVWEATDQENWSDPDATWERHQIMYGTEREAVGKWQSVKMYVNTRPVSIDPEPDWSRYTYDGRTPISKW